MANLLTFKILSGYTRPIISVAKDITCLIDTGADTPVWTQGSETLKDAFHAERVKGKKFMLSGFGKEAEIVDVYNLFDVVMQDSNSKRLVFKNMTVACTVRPNMAAYLILPATALSHMNYTIRNTGVESPILEIESDKDMYYVNPVYSSVDNTFIKRVYSFANE